MSSQHDRLTRQKNAREAVEQARAEEAAEAADAQLTEVDLALLLATEDDVVRMNREDRDTAEIVARATGHQVHDDEERAVLLLIPRNPNQRRAKQRDLEERAAKLSQAVSGSKRLSSTAGLREHNEAYLRDVAAGPDYPESAGEMYRLQVYARRLFGGDPEILLMRAVAAVGEALTEWYRLRDLAEREEQRRAEATLPRVREAPDASNLLHSYA